MTQTTNQQTSANLTMVAVAATSGAGRSAPRSLGRLVRFDVIRLIQNLGTFLLVVVLSAAAYLAINRFLMEVVQIVGVSMVPTLQENGHYVLNRWALHNHDPKQQDIVVLRDPQDHGYSVKRIIATTGDSVLFRNGKVIVNGKELTEPYLASGTHTYTYSQAKEQMITCGKDQYFVLGDNRLRSIDSRVYGPVPRENILGLVVVR